MTEIRFKRYLNISLMSHTFDMLLFEVVYYLFKKLLFNLCKLISLPIVNKIMSQFIQLDRWSQLRKCPLRAISLCPWFAIEGKRRIESQKNIIHKNEVPTGKTITFSKFKSLANWRHNLKHLSINVYTKQNRVLFWFCHIISNKQDCHTPHNIHCSTVHTHTHITQTYLNI